MKKALKIFLKSFVALIVILNLIIVFSGRSYLYKGVYNTYLQGRSKPSALEYHIFENRKIIAENPKPWPLGLEYNTSKIPQEIETHFREVKTHAYVIIKQDSLIHEQYWDGFSDTSHTNSFSMSKSYVATLLGCAFRDGYIKSLDEPVWHYIPEFKNDWRSTITLRHLATMTSGIKFDEDYSNPLAYPAEGYYGTDLYKTSIKYDEKEYEPGKVYRYLSGNSALLGYCISKAVKKTLSEYLSERLWSPMGCEHEAYWSLDHKDGQEKAFCCINSNVKDFARMGKLFLHFGNWDGTQLLDSSYVANSWVPFHCKETDGSDNHTYSYGWYLTEHKGLRVFYMRGILTQYVICLPEKQMVIARLGRKSRPKTEVHCPPDVAYAIDAALAMYDHKRE